MYVYVPLSYRDTINYPCPNADVGVANIWK